MLNNSEVIKSWSQPITTWGEIKESIVTRLDRLQGKAIEFPFTESLDKNLHQFKRYVIAK